MQQGQHSKREEEEENETTARACSCDHTQGVQQTPVVVKTELPLQLHGARTEPSALLKVQGSVHRADGTVVSVQPMIDSGASGTGFADPAFVTRSGAVLRPSQQRITLADGSVVRATGEATLTYSVGARDCGSKNEAPPAQFTSTFIVTPLAPYELILGVGWLEQHHVQIGFRERSIQLRVNGSGKQHCIRPLARMNDSGDELGAEAPVVLQSISTKALHKQLRRGQVHELYAVTVNNTGGIENAHASAATSTRCCRWGCVTPRARSCS